MKNHKVFRKRDSIGKRGVFFQIIILVGFQFILFTAIILSMSKDSSTGSVTDISSAILGLDRKLDYETSSSQVYLSSEVNDYVRSIFTSGELYGDGEKSLCVKYKGFQVINGPCIFDQETFKKNIARRISDACYSYFKQDCSIEFNPQSAMIKISSKEKETEYSYSLLYGTYSKKTSISKKINEYASLVKAKTVSDSLSSCSDLSCVQEKVKTMPEIEMVYSDPDVTRKILSDVVSELDSCERHIDSDCNCFSFDFSRLPEGSEIVFSRHDIGYSADFVIDGNVMLRDFFRRNYENILSWDKAKNNISELKITKYGIFSKDGWKMSPYIQVVGSDSADYLQFSEDSKKRTCDDKFFLSSTDDSSYKILSKLSISNSIASSSNQAMHISVLEDKDLSDSVLAKISVVSDDGNMRSGVIGNSILELLRLEFGKDKTLSGKISFDPISRVPRYSIYDQVPGLSVGTSGVILIQIRVKSMQSYTEGISDYSIFKDTLVSTMKKAIQNNIDMPYYPETKTAILRLKGDNIAEDDRSSGFFFATVLEDKTPPDNARSIELRYPEISDNTVFIRFLPSISTDISGYNVYFSKSDAIPERPSFKVFLKNSLDTDKQINGFDTGNYFARYVTKTVGISGTYKALVGSYFEFAGAETKNTDIPDRYKIYSVIRDYGAGDEYSIKEMYIALKPNDDDKYVFLTAFDLSGNENKAVEPVALDIGKIQKIPATALCNLESFSLGSKSIICETPTRTIFGEDWNSEKYGTLMKKTYYACLDDLSKDMIFDLTKEGFPTEGDYNVCIGQGKKMYFMISFDTDKKSSQLYIKKAKELYKDTWRMFLIDSGFVPYLISSKAYSADGSTSITYYLEKTE